MQEFRQTLIETLVGYRDQLAIWLPKLMIALLVGLFFYLLSLLLSRALRRVLVRRLHDSLLGVFLARIMKWSVMIIGCMICLRILGFGGVAGGVLAGAGVGAFVIGFAFKDIGENFLAGILMAFSRPFRVGDTVEANGIVGSVVAIDLRNTHLKTGDGKDVYIPNASVIKNPLLNHTIDGFMRYDFTFGIDQDDDYDKAMDVLMRTVKTIPGVLNEEKTPVVVISGTDVNAVLLQVFFWVNTFDKSIPVSRIKTEVLGRCTKALITEGFYLPNTVMELKNYRNQRLELRQLS